MANITNADIGKIAFRNGPWQYPSLSVAGRITSISGKRVYLETVNIQIGRLNEAPKMVNDDAYIPDPNGFIAADSIVLVVDTAGDVNIVIQESWNNMKAYNTFMKAMKDEWNKFLSIYDTGE